MSSHDIGQTKCRNCPSYQHVYTAVVLHVSSRMMVFGSNLHNPFLLVPLLLFLQVSIMFKHVCAHNIPAASIIIRMVPEWPRDGAQSHHQ